MHILNEFFDKIYCINLDSRTDRWEECEKMFNHYGLSVERVSPKIPTIDKGGLMTTEYSLILTNIDIIKKSKENNYSKILIFEDDVEFCDYFETYTGPSFYERFNKSIVHLPKEWNLFYLGSGIDTGEKSLIGDELYSIRFAHTTHAVGINSTFFDECINRLENCHTPLDITYVHVMKELGYVYSFYPNLVSQRASYSDIQSRYVDYTHLRNYISLNK
jgi:hypothetical protein